MAAVGEAADRWPHLVVNGSGQRVHRDQIGVFLEALYVGLCPLLAERLGAVAQDLHEVGIGRLAELHRIIWQRRGAYARRR